MNNTKKNTRPSDLWYWNLCPIITTFLYKILLDRMYDDIYANREPKEFRRVLNWLGVGSVYIDEILEESHRWISEFKRNENTIKYKILEQSRKYIK